MSKVTAYNQDVQRYLQGAKSTNIRKSTIIDIIKESVLATEKSFDKLFPNRSKRKDVMDEIIFYLSGRGICKVAAETLAKNTKTSVRTVYDAVKNLKETGEILVGGLADGKNKYIFVLKSHPNFKEILREVFFIDELPVEKQPEDPVDPKPEPEQPEVPIEDPSKNNNIADQNAERIADHISEPQNAEIVDTVGMEEGDPSSNLNNSFNFFNSLKQEKNNYIASIQNEIESDLKKASKDKKKELERINTYYVNKYQEKLYHSIKSGSYHPAIEKDASIIGLRVGSNATKTMFTGAIQAVIKIDRFLVSGGIVKDSIPALFSKIYRDRVKALETPKKRNPEETESTEGYKRRVPFYNWLETDGSAPVKAIAPYNWLKEDGSKKLNDAHNDVENREFIVKESEVFQNQLINDSQIFDELLDSTFEESLLDSKFDELLDSTFEESKDELNDLDELGVF